MSFQFNSSDAFDADFDREHDPYEAYAETFNRADRQARRKRKPQPTSKPKAESAAPLTDAPDTAAADWTYRPSKFEAGYLTESLQPFFDRRLIVDVLASVAGGKEASVYCAAAHPDVTAETGVTLFAAKVYRPRMFRALRNDSLYREGRGVMLSETGTLLKANEDRVVRALKKKTGFGQQVAHTSWLMYEYSTLAALHSAGVAVPQPIGVEANAILMTYIGDADGPAPRLADVEIDPAEAAPLFASVLHSVEIMLRHGWIHGDLSAYNLLYFDGALTLIDFPQVTQAHSNSHAAAILERDVQRVAEYFAKFGLITDARTLSRDLWRRYVERDARTRAADLSRLLETDDPQL